ncbi:hypothetical protein Lfu02_52670 [Longispora fulva]|uniref:Cell division protein YceG involved in septum cleavage n=1 Tax=Longispora fulva TaxID=619741 RepID=A0A8J7KP11_9ACTN|nr:endolytic transglycosylase MltG [Longispora fulva]MBG6140841.1 cell division protein YceG involved in septum cleavage [Longispora fulva]GIG60895.1 hypothetical protein Lfu02_52670 [Longispora fulva]
MPNEQDDWSRRVEGWERADDAAESRTGVVKVVAWTLGVALVLVCGVVMLLGRKPGPLFDPADYPGPGTGEAVVRVHDRQPLNEIAQILKDADVVKSARAFLEVAGTDIAPGTYTLRRQMRARDAYNLMRGQTPARDTPNPSRSTTA